MRTHILSHTVSAAEAAFVLKNLILFHGKRHPAEMGDFEVAAFSTHLAVVGKIRQEDDQTAGPVCPK